MLFVVTLLLVLDGYVLKQNKYALHDITWISQKDE